MTGSGSSQKALDIGPGAMWYELVSLWILGAWVSAFVLSYGDQDTSIRSRAKRIGVLSWIQEP
jgi:hypothetical protein